MNLSQIRPDVNVQMLNNKELLMAHMTTHAYYKEFRRGRGKEHWDLEQVIETHNEIREEIEQRDDVEHDYINALDNEAVEAEALHIEMQHKETTAEKWVDELLQADSVDKHIRENPPSADWFSKAANFLQQEDASIDLEDHVKFSSKSFDQVDESVQEWVQEAHGEEVGVVGYYLNEQTESGVLFVEDGVEYHLYADTLPVASNESQTEALESYDALTRLLQDGVRAERARNIIKQQDEWVIPNNPSDYGMAEPDTSWGDVDKSMSAYLSGEDADADSWEDASEDVRSTITSYHSASASGNPADNFSDLWGPHHRPGGDVVYNGVVAAKAANSGARSDPDTPTDIRDDIESHLNSHLEEFADEYDDIEGPEQMLQAHTHAVSDEQGPHYADENPRSDKRYRWYVWDQEEAEMWLENQEGFELTEPEQDANFVRYEQTDQELYDTKMEWRGPAYPDYGHTPVLDGRPVLFEVGFVNETPEGQDYDETTVKAVMFQIEEPPDIMMMDEEQVEQAAKIQSDLDFYWYVWERSEAETYLMENALPHSNTEKDGNFYRIELEDPNQYEEVIRTWEGSRSSVDGVPAGGQKPRRVVYGVTEEGEKERQAIEFLVSNPFEAE